jgi:Leucine-rich repeat (LRR) protein
MIGCFSLRDSEVPPVSRSATLAILVLCPLASAAEQKPTDAESELIALVQKLGGTAKLSGELEPDFRVAAVFEKADDTLLAALIKHPTLGSLDLRSAAKVTDKGFAALKELPNLQRLYLSGCSLEPADATAIGSLRPLTALVLGGCRLSDAEVVKLAKLKNLKVLDLMDTPVSDKAVETLLTLTKLEELNLSGTRVTDAGAKKLTALEGLRLLQLNNTKVSGEAIGAMEEVLRSSKRGTKILR